MSSSDSGLEMLHESEWGVHDWRSCRSLDWFMYMESCKSLKWFRSEEIQESGAVQVWRNGMNLDWFRPGKAARV